MMRPSRPFFAARLRSAGRVTNVSRRFPQLLVALAENRISVTVPSLLAAHVNEDNVDKLILAKLIY